MAKAFKGRWRISEMDVWDNDYLDLVEPAHIVFESENDGAFVFGTDKGCSTFVTEHETARHAPSSPGTA
jgi:NAD-specific glutamate dehydrogenase